jgi:adenylate cyclase
VSRLGDVFGQTVNIASRLTTHARAGTVLVDENAAAALRGIDGYALRPLRPTSVRGYHHLRAWRLGREATADSA